MRLRPSLDVGRADALPYAGQRPWTCNPKLKQQIDILIDNYLDKIGMMMSFLVRGSVEYCWSMCQNGWVWVWGRDRNCYSLHSCEHVCTYGFFKKFLKKHPLAHQYKRKRELGRGMEPWGWTEFNLGLISLSATLPPSLFQKKRRHLILYFSSSNCPPD